MIFTKFSSLINIGPAIIPLPFHETFSKFTMRSIVYHPACSFRSLIPAVAILLPSHKLSSRRPQSSSTLSAIIEYILNHLSTMLGKLSDAKLRDDRIWIEVGISDNTYSKGRLAEKHEKVAKCLKYGASPDTMIILVQPWVYVPYCDAYYNKYAVAYGSKTINEHLRALKRLKDLHDDDLCAFMYLEIIDTRPCVINIKHDKLFELPIIGGSTHLMYEPLHGICTHFKPGDIVDYDARDELIQSIYPQPVHSLSLSVCIIGGIKCRVVRIGHRYTKEHIVTVRYFGIDDRTTFEFAKSVTCLCDVASSAPMLAIYQDSICWLRDTKTIDRQCYRITIRSLNNDPYMLSHIRDRFLKLLQRKYVIGELKTYKVSKKPDTWANMNFERKMEYIYNNHMDWLKCQPAFTVEQHQYWEKIYLSDPVMDDKTRIDLRAHNRGRFRLTILAIPDMPIGIDHSETFDYWHKIESHRFLSD